MPKYIIQKSEPNCGAFATAYYKWETIAPAASAADAEKEVAAIYKEVMFAADAPPIPKADLTLYSDPVKIMQYLNNVCKMTGCIFHYNPQTIIKVLLDFMKAGNERGTILGWEVSGKVVAKPLELASDGYIISLCYQCKEGITLEATTDPERVHYVLIKKAGSDFFMCNSWDGDFRKVPPEFMASKVTVPSGICDHLLYLQAGILIK